jgi:probable O-glycosylation ligase (exosortase A-associated)
MPIRDLLITAIFISVLPRVFIHAWIGVLLWTWISVMNPHRLAWGFAHGAPFAAIAGGAALIALFTTKDPVRLAKSGPVYALIAFVVWMCVTTVFAVFPESSFNQLNKVIKIQLMTLVALAVLHEKKHIELFVWVNALSLGFYGLKGGIYTIQTAGGGTVWGPGGFIGGNNEIGLAMLVAIPLQYYLYQVSDKRWIRWILLATMLLSAVAVLGTRSRGAFLAILAMGLVLWVRAPGNKILPGITILVVGASLFTFMPQSWHDRMATIGTYEQDGSAMGRINAWETAINIANHKPTGAGFSMYNRTVFNVYAPRPAEQRAADPSTPRAAHSNYFQVLGEHGWVGLALYLAIWWLTWRDAAQLRRLTKGRADLSWVFRLAGMCQVSLVGFMVGGAFLSLAYFDLPYNLMIIVVVTKRWLLLKLNETQGSSAANTSGPVAAAPGSPMGVRA